VLNVDGCNYLAVISAISKVGQLNKANINKVTAVKLLPFKPGQIVNPETF